MRLHPALSERFGREHLSAIDAQRLAEFIAWGPVVFQCSRLMVKTGILQLLGHSDCGMTRQQIADATGLTDYAVKCLLEASLAIGTVVVDPDSDRYSMTKTGWFLLNDAATRVNMDFNHDINYRGMYHLEEALRDGKPAGLKTLGDWPTIYEGLSALPEPARTSWFGFDHFYSDAAFPEALRIVFGSPVRTLYDVGGNTGKWALQCVGYDPQVRVTILDLPQQIALMQQHISGCEGAGRISGHAIDLLDADAPFPCSGERPDAIWMSQFLDCFSMPQAVSILRRAREVMTADTRLYIMETLWDRQRFEAAAFCLTMTSLYFTAMANGNSKMYNTDDLEHCIHEAGLRIEHIHDGLGHGHSVVVVRV